MVLRAVQPAPSIPLKNAEGMRSSGDSPPGNNEKSDVAWSHGSPRVW
jgi:hypothetical protein